MKRTGGQVVVDALVAAGVSHCFGVPGESYMGLLDAMIDSPLTFVSTRHEGGASFMASGYSRISDEIAVCSGTRAVGSANLAIGVHNAMQDSMPMIAIAGGVNTDFAGREAFQEVDLVAAMTPFTKLAMTVPSADRAAEVMARAIHVATSGRPGPVFVVLPQDVCDEATEASAWPTTPVVAPAPDPSAVRAVVDALLGARRPLLWAGGGISRSAQAVRYLAAFAESTGIGVMTSWRHYDGFPNDHPLYLGSTGIGAPGVVWERLAEADVVVALGNRLQEHTTEGYRYPGPDTRLYQVDIDPSVMVRSAPAALGVVADVTEFLAAMGAALADGAGADTGTGTDRDRRLAATRADRARYRPAVTLPSPAPGSESAEGVAYPELFASLERRLAGDVVVTADAGNFHGWLSRYHTFRRPRTYLGPASGAMGHGLPAAIGAAFANPDVPVVALSGDGGFAMTMSELETAVRHGRHVVAVVCDNSRHGTIRMHQERAHPGRVIGTDLGVTDFSLVARGLGAAGVCVEDGGAFDEALVEALGRPGPTVIHARMDRDQLSVEGRLPAS